VSSTLLYNGSRFTGHQKSKGNQYDVEVVLQVKAQKGYDYTPVHLLQEIHRSQNATSMMWRLYYTFKAEKSAR
jgi:hypothetical protein